VTCACERSGVLGSQHRPRHAPHRRARRLRGESDKERELDTLIDEIEAYGVVVWPDATILGGKGSSTSYEPFAPLGQDAVWNDCTCRSIVFTVVMMERSVYCPDGTRISASTLVTMLALAAVTWGLIYVAGLGIWTSRAAGSAVKVTLHEPDTQAPRSH
jgi:hypothetical protein